MHGTPLHTKKSMWLQKYLNNFMSNFPSKCWSCFKAGICYCRFWSLDFNCQTVDKLREMEKLEVLLNSFPRQLSLEGGIHG
jgi:hypothetical protein